MGTPLPTSKMSNTVAVSAEEYDKFQEWKAAQDLAAQIESAVANAVAKHDQFVATETAKHNKNVEALNASHSKLLETHRSELDGRIAAIRAIRHVPPTVFTANCAPICFVKFTEEESVNMVMEKLTCAVNSFGPDHIIGDGFVRFSVALPCSFFMNFGSNLKTTVREKLGYEFVSDSHLICLLADEHINSTHCYLLCPANNGVKICVPLESATKLKQSNWLDYKPGNLPKDITWYMCIVYPVSRKIIGSNNFKQ